MLCSSEAPTEQITPVGQDKEDVGPNAAGAFPAPVARFLLLVRRPLSFTQTSLWCSRCVSIRVTSHASGPCDCLSALVRAMKMSEGGHILQLVCSCPIQFESTNRSDLTCSPGGAAPFSKLLQQGEEAFAAASVHTLPRLGVPVPALIRLSGTGRRFPETLGVPVPDLICLSGAGQRSPETLAVQSHW